METTINECINLINAFLSAELNAEEFAVRYDHAFRFDWTDMDKQLFSILQDLWEDTECYSPLWLPEEIGPYNITADTLRSEALKALNELNVLQGRCCQSDKGFSNT